MEGKLSKPEGLMQNAKNKQLFKGKNEILNNKYCEI